MKKSQKFWLTILVLATLAGDWVGYTMLTENIYNEQRYCGTVVYKSTDEVAIKYGTRTRLYLGVQFEEVGRLAIETNIDTYVNKKVGDPVCFTLEDTQVGKEGPNIAWLIIKSMFGILAGIVTLVGIVYIIIEVVEHFNAWMDGK